MPDYFSHRIFAEKIYEKLDGETRKLIENLNLYIVGSQGGDIFFMYNATLSDKNIGRRLHRADPENLFKILCKGNFSYAAGFATHYALDSTLHPIVYAFEEGKKGMFIHQKFEEDLGLYISRHYCERRQLLPRERLLSCSGAIYDTMKQFEPSLTLTGVERTLKRFFIYSRKLYNSKRPDYRYNYDFSQVPQLLAEAENTALKAIDCVKERAISPEVFSKKFL